MLRRKPLVEVIRSLHDSWRVSLQRSPGVGPRRPGPLKIEATEVAGYVDDFANEKQVGDFPALHRFCRKLVGVNAARRHFSFLVSLCAFWRDSPRMRFLLDVSQRGIRP